MLMITTYSYFKTEYPAVRQCLPRDIPMHNRPDIAETGAPAQSQHSGPDPICKNINSDRS